MAIVTRIVNEVVEWGREIGSSEIVRVKVWDALVPLIIVQPRVVQRRHDYLHTMPSLSGSRM